MFYSILNISKSRDIPDPAELPRALMDEFLAVLDAYGPCAADAAAAILYSRIDRLRTREKYERHFLLLGVVFTEMAKIRKDCDDAFAHLSVVERMDKFSTPKLARLLDVLRSYRPKTINSNKGRMEKESGNDCRVEPKDDLEVDPSKDEPEDDPKDETKDCEGGEASQGPEREEEAADADDPEKGGDQGESEKSATPQKPEKPRAHQRRHRPRRGRGGGGLNSNEDPSSLYGAIFVDGDLRAQVLFNILRDLSTAAASPEVDDNEAAFSFLRPAYYNAPESATSKMTTSDAAEEGAKRKKKHEEALRKFRSRDCNVIVCGSGDLECGAEAARCNLVLDLDAPEGFRSHAFHKVRASSSRAVARHVVFCAEEDTRGVLERLALFRVVEGRLKRATAKANQFDLALNYAAHGEGNGSCRGKRGSTPSLDTAIGIINRYCARLPSDTFTRLTPVQAVRKLNEKCFLAAILLPINR